MAAREGLASQPINSSSEDIVAEESKQYIDSYTLAMRQAQDLIGPKRPLRTRIKMRIEGLNRRLWYVLIRAMTNNPPPKRRIPISEVRGVFIIPFGDAIGDLVVASAVYRAIKRRNPK